MQNGTLTFYTRPSANFRVKICTTEAELQRGLQGLRSIGDREGMIFPSDEWPKEGSIAMWMASVEFPLAMIWVAADGRVNSIQLANPGDKRTFTDRGVFCLEINQRVVDQIGLKPGMGCQITS